MKKIYKLIILNILFLTLQGIGQPADTLALIRAFEKLHQCDDLQLLMSKTSIDGKSKNLKIAGSALLTCGYYEQALKYFIRLNETDPKQGLLESARCYALLNKEQECLSYLAKYLQLSDKKRPAEIKLDPSFSSISKTAGWETLWKTEWYNRYEMMLADAWYEFENHHHQASLEILENLLEKRPRMHKAYVLKAMIFACDSNFTAATGAMDKAIKNNTKEAQHYKLRGQYYYNQKKYHKALADFETASAYDDSDPEIILNLAEALFKTGKIDDAAEKIEIYRQFFPDDIDGLIVAAKIYLQAGSQLKAMEMLGKAILNERYNPDLYVMRGKIFFESGAWDYAEKDYSMAMDFIPYQPDLYYMRGLCRIELKNRKGACIDFARARRYGRIKTDEELRKYCLDCLEEVQKAAGL